MYTDECCYNTLQITLPLEYCFPDALKPFIRYLPSDEPSLNSTVLNEERLLQHWKCYLMAESQKWN